MDPDELGHGRSADAAQASRLLVHETVTCRTLQGRDRYQEIAMSMTAFSLLGTWQIVGMTGTWPTVLNLWEVPGGWAGWSAFLHRTYGGAKAAMTTHFEKFDEVRSGGTDRLVAPTSWSPTTDELRDSGVRGTLFVHERTTVRPGTAHDYLDAQREDWTPVAADNGHHLIGAYEVLLSDSQVVTVWATDVESHIGLMRSADPRIIRWRTRAREWATDRHEELMSPAPGTLLAAPVPARDR